MFRLVLGWARQLTGEIEGAAGNIGLYAAGVPVGLLTDTKGPRISMLLGATLMGLGYFPIYLGMLRSSGPRDFMLMIRDSLCRRKRECGLRNHSRGLLSHGVGELSCLFSSNQGWSVLKFSLQPGFSLRLTGFKRRAIFPTPVALRRPFLWPDSG